MSNKVGHDRRRAHHRPLAGLVSLAPAPPNTRQDTTGTTAERAAA